MQQERTYRGNRRGISWQAAHRHRRVVVVVAMMVAIASTILFPATRTSAQINPIDARYAELERAGMSLGTPMSSELSTPDGSGRYRHYQWGSIYWTVGTGAQEVRGAIRDKWAALGYERGFLGYPTTGELPTPDGIGRFNQFQGGSIYWTPQTGAHEVHGAIRRKWAERGYEVGAFGYPTTDELVAPNGTNPVNQSRFNNFQHGSIGYFWVSEKEGRVDTGIDVRPGDRLEISAGGKIWAGVVLTGENGPTGWPGWRDPASRYPTGDLYSLIGTLNGHHFSVGSFKDLTVSATWPVRIPGDRPSRLYLEINDIKAGDGSGHFEGYVLVSRPR